jgi:hypothetical protein
MLMVSITRTRRAYGSEIKQRSAMVVQFLAIDEKHPVNNLCGQGRQHASSRGNALPPSFNILGSRASLCNVGTVGSQAAGFLSTRARS